MKILDTQNFKETEIGLIPEEWEVVNLEKVTSFISRGVTPSYTEKSDVVVLNQKCVRDGRVGFEEARLTDPVAQKIPSNKYLEPFDVLINSTGQGTLGRVGQVKQLLQKTTADSHLTIVRPDHREIDPVFVGYFLRNIQPLIESFAEGSTGQTELSREKVKTILLPLPSASEQHRIASILSSLDDKIELNRQINANIEKMASALFKRWFVDFEFPDEKGRPYKSSEGKMVETEIGEVPEGWRVGVLTDICILNPSYKMQKTTVAKYVEMKDLPEVGLGIKGYIERPFTAGSKFCKHDTLLARITPCLENGKTGFVNFLEDGEVGWGSTEFIVIHPKSTNFEEYLYLLSRSKDFREFAIQSMSGSSGRQRVQIDRLMSYAVIIPDDDTINKFHESVAVLFIEIFRNNNQVKTLSEIRDSLLPRLMNGKVRTR